MAGTEKKPPTALDLAVAQVAQQAKTGGMHAPAPIDFVTAPKGNTILSNDNRVDRVTLNRRGDTAETNRVALPGIATTTQAGLMPSHGNVAPFVYTPSPGTRPAPTTGPTDKSALGPTPASGKSTGDYKPTPSSIYESITTEALRDTFGNLSKSAKAIQEKYANQRPVTTNAVNGELANREQMGTIPVAPVKTVTEYPYSLVDHPVGATGDSLVSKGTGLSYAAMNKLKELGLEGDEYWKAVAAINEGSWDPFAYTGRSQAMLYDMKSASPEYTEQAAFEEFANSPEEKARALDFQRDNQPRWVERKLGRHTSEFNLEGGGKYTDFLKAQNDRWAGDRDRRQAALIEQGKQAGRISDREYELLTAKYTGGINQRGQEGELLRAREAGQLALDLGLNEQIAAYDRAMANNDTTLAAEIMKTINSNIENRRTTRAAVTAAKYRDNNDASGDKYTTGRINAYTDVIKTYQEQLDTETDPGKIREIRAQIAKYSAIRDSLSGAPAAAPASTQSAADKLASLRKPGA